MQSIRCQGLPPGLDAPQTETRGRTLGGVTETTCAGRNPGNRRLPPAIPQVSPTRGADAYRCVGSPRISADPPDPAAAPVPAKPSLPPDPRDPAEVPAPWGADALGADAGTVLGCRGRDFFVASGGAAAAEAGRAESIFPGCANESPLPHPSKTSKPAAALFCTFHTLSMLGLRCVPVFEAADMPSVSVRSHDSCCPVVFQRFVSR
jgi:hypothetical protein